MRTAGRHVSTALQPSLDVWDVLLTTTTHTHSESGTLALTWKFIDWNSGKPYISLEKTKGMSHESCCTPEIAFIFSWAWITTRPLSQHKPTVAVCYARGLYHKFISCDAFAGGSPGMPSGIFREATFDEWCCVYICAFLFQGWISSLKSEICDLWKFISALSFDLRLHSFDVLYLREISKLSLIFYLLLI